MRRPTRTLLPLFLSALLLAACSGDEGTPDGGAADDAGTVTDGGTATDGGTSEDAGIPGPVDSCEEIASIECFANNECETDERCQDVGPADLAVPCCITGARGTLAAGEPCDPVEGQLECASGVCVQGNGQSRCSGTCEVDTDCPEGMQACTAMMFSTTEDMWCMPE